MISADNEAAGRAKAALITLLDLDHDMTWDDIVTYAHKSKSALRMTQEAMRRRDVQLATALGLPADTKWPILIRTVIQREGKR